MSLVEYIMDKYGIIQVNKNFLIKYLKYTDGEIERFCGGCASELFGHWVIWVDESLVEEEEQFTYFHEIAHLIFGHVKPDRLIPSESENQQMQLTADSFASTLVALHLFHEWQSKEKDGESNG